MPDLNVKPGMFRNGCEALRTLGIGLLLSSWVVAAIGFAFWLVRWRR